MSATPSTMSIYSADVLFIKPILCVGNVDEQTRDVQQDFSMSRDISVDRKFESELTRVLLTLISMFKQRRQAVSKQKVKKKEKKITNHQIMCMQYKLSKGVCSTDLVNLLLVGRKSLSNLGWATYYPSILV